MLRKAVQRSRWNLLYLVLAGLILFSVFAVPKIAVLMVERTRGQIVTIEPQG